MTPGTLILGAIAVPLAGAALIAAAHRVPNLREGVTLVTASSLFAVVVLLAPELLAGGRPGVQVARVMPGIDLAFRVEPLGMLFALVASGEARATLQPGACFFVASAALTMLAYAWINLLAPSAVAQASSLKARLAGLASASKAGSA